jgi:hypothetical protein
MKERHEKTLGSERHARVASPSPKAGSLREPVQFSAPAVPGCTSPEWRKYAASRLRHFASSR